MSDHDRLTEAGWEQFGSGWLHPMYPKLSGVLSYQGPAIQDMLEAAEQRGREKERRS